MKNTFSILLCIATLFSCGSSKVQDETVEGFKPLFSGKNFDGWHLKLRNGDEELAKKVYAIEDDIIHVFNDELSEDYDLVNGENDTHGILYTEKKYTKYILKFDYKWGSNQANNFKDWQYDAGIYYHLIDDKIWPTGIEYQIQYNHIKNENHTGDLIRPNKTDYEWFSDEKTKTYLSEKNGGTRKNDTGSLHFAKPTTNYNGTNDKWNQCEIIVMGGDYSIHKLNGEVVNVALNLTPQSGAIAFTSVTAEIFYRNIQIKEFEESRPIETYISN